MPLNFNDLIKKAKEKGIYNVSDSTIRPWQQESVFFNPLPKSTNNKTNIHGKNRENAEQTQTKIKNNTNLTQTRHKLDTKPNTNVTQTQHELGATQPETNTNLTQTRHKPNTEPNTNLTQTRHKPNTEPNTKYIKSTKQKNEFSSITRLSGVQKKLTYMTYFHSKLYRDGQTPPLSMEYICNTTKIKKGSIKTSIKRLVTKKILTKADYKSGRDGWVQLTLPEQIYRELLNLELSGNLTNYDRDCIPKPNTNLTQIEHKSDTEPNTEPNTSAPVVSSSYIINTTTTRGELPDNWKNIDITSLESINFNQTHLMQIHREYKENPSIALSPELIQDSIDALAFDIKHNNAINSFRRPAAVVLTSLLKQGKPYSSKTPEKFKTPQQEAMDTYLVAKQRQQQAQLETEGKIKELEFFEWESSLSEEDILELCPETDVPPGVPQKLFKTMRKKMAKSLAKDYFDAEIWPLKKMEIMKK